MGNDPKIIGPRLFTTRSGVHSAPTIIDTKLFTLESEVQDVPHRALARVIGDSLFNSGSGMSAIILPTQTMTMTVNVQSIVLLAQEPNASSIEVKSTKQMQLHDDVRTSPPKKNATICGCVGTPI